MAPVSGERMDDKILRYMQRVVRNSRNPEFMNEVKDACLKKQAFCFEAPDGFLVLRSVLSADGIPYVLVLLGVCTGSNSVERYLPEVKTLTRLAGGRWLNFIRQGGDLSGWENVWALSECRMMRMASWCSG